MIREQLICGEDGNAAGEFLPDFAVGQQRLGIIDDDGVGEIAERGFDERGIFEIGRDGVGNDALDVGDCGRCCPPTAGGGIALLEDFADDLRDAFALGLQIVKHILAALETGAEFALAGQLLRDGGHFLAGSFLLLADLVGLGLQQRGLLGELVLAGFVFGDLGLELGNLLIDDGLALFEPGLLIGEIFAGDLERVDVGCRRAI